MDFLLLSRFQFGTNWGAFSVFVDGIFGPILAFETTSSFFPESVFRGIWISGWEKTSKGFHAACMWLVFIASSFSRFCMCWRLPMYFRAWSASAITIAGAALFGLVGLFPRLLPSTIDAAFSLTTSNSASEPLSLKIMFIIVSIFIPLVLIYQGYAYSIFKHPVTADDIESEETY